jgi:sterol desaturase/sphingolipid hydroxylase (fatty acid hydroxylase superfamily)
MINPILYVIPFFLGLMLLEHQLTLRRGRSTYTFKETIGNLFCAVGQFFIELFFKIPLIWLYLFLSRHALKNELVGPAKWVALFVLIDFLFWLSHFTSHKIKWMWAIHGVHHQAEHYNFSVGLRMPWWHKLTAFWIYLPPALLGFSLGDYILMATVQAGLQIWTHTTLLEKRLPVFEWIFVTPSHHRVHHGQNRIYIDKNFGGILSVWDYVFKTYQAETEAVRFGIPAVKPRANPWSSNLVQFVPNIMPELPKFQRIPTKEKRLIGIILISLVTLACWTIVVEDQLTLVHRGSLVMLVLGSIIFLGTWIDHREDWFKDVRFALFNETRKPGRHVHFDRRGLKQKKSPFARDVIYARLQEKQRKN